ncbi:DUF1585 domain-containing protein [Sorangium sp. So ce1151]|uniref:DUF1585 domain-containing protein n=1 Tax=Sorangium sp. So ce1151 TaxID=3133332 RepID=UPI003F5E0505
MTWRTLRAEDACTKPPITTAFKASGYYVKQLLLDLTQTDAFHYITVAHQE